LGPRWVPHGRRTRYVGGSAGVGRPSRGPPLEGRRRPGLHQAPPDARSRLPGVSEGEDIRAADSLLRLQVADKIRNARSTVENTRQALVQANQFSALTDLAPLIADLWKLEGEVRNAEQGFTGISPAVRVNPQQIDRLYEYDFGFAQAGDQLAQTVSALPGLVAGPSASQAGAVIATARGQVNQLDQAFKARVQAIEGIRVS
jgi:hypothetical protein